MDFGDQSQDPVLQIARVGIGGIPLPAYLALGHARSWLHPGTSGQNEAASQKVCSVADSSSCWVTHNILEPCFEELVDRVQLARCLLRCVGTVPGSKSSNSPSFCQFLPNHSG